MRPSPLALIATLLFAACHSPADQNSVESLYKESVRELDGANLLGGVTAEYIEKQGQRVQRTRELVLEGKVETALQCMYASAIMISSGLPDDLELARDLGFRAAQLGEDRGLPLAAESIDKLMVGTGRLQKYGTQMIYIPVLDVFRLEPVDPTTSDDERRAMGLPPLVELKARVDEMNQLKEEQGL